ncbi:hypothetical protein BOTBODRAFT_290216 [Botryobasidium botryosum FD-172 SS1]|uniref:Uncharacterized protein n=1 Tax=Botryobasidium botryosum (strain FD-172 SS1) TaxID=930990 RepID=A0A067MUZ8_BOTB1|nr:hypothetical protein BOTBODRAFT_290216 [Botryobasidium botryosum FD-172 SS1]
MEAGHKLFKEAMKRIIGVKPKLGDGDETVQEYPIPESEYCIRVWGGGLVDDGRCCFDFTQNGRAVNTPPEYKIISIPQPTDSFPEEVEVKSAEASAGIKDIIEGEEKYFVEQGAHYRVIRPNKPDVIFVIPYYAPPKPRLSPKEVRRRAPYPTMPFISLNSSLPCKNGTWHPVGSGLRRRWCTGCPSDNC